MERREENQGQSKERSSQFSCSAGISVVVSKDLEGAGHECSTQTSTKSGQYSSPLHPSCVSNSCERVKGARGTGVACKDGCCSPDQTTREQQRWRLE